MLDYEEMLGINILRNVHTNAAASMLLHLNGFEEVVCSS